MAPPGSGERTGPNVIGHPLLERWTNSVWALAAFGTRLDKDPDPGGRAAA